MSNYTPTTEDVREAYKSGAWLRSDDQESAWKPEVYAPRYYAEFDRWLSAHDRLVQAEAWEWGLIQGRAASISGIDLGLLTNPYEKGSDDER